MDRPDQHFPTRSYGHPPGGEAQALGSHLAAPALEAGAIYRFVLGRDARPFRLRPDEVRVQLHDAFSRIVLGAGRTPATMRSLLTCLDQDDPAEVRARRSFVVADGGQIPWTIATADLRRELRFVVCCGRAGAEPSLIVSTSSAFDSETTFLQVIAWDAVAGAYQFYDRRQGAWIWAGSSWDALAPGSRGKGPFDSHVNGALNMKELKAPWPHWHSMAASIDDSVFAPEDPIVTEPFWLQRDKAETFEMDVARPGIARWTAARFERCRSAGRLSRLPEFLRQVLTTTTVNLVASPTEHEQLATGVPVPLPITFFLNADALLDELGLDPGPGDGLSVDGGLYAEALRHYDVALMEGKHRFPGDTHFVFLVPEPSLEDTLVLRGLRQSGVLSARLAACLLMVDFPNPVYSARRAALLRHVPESSALGDEADFERAFLGSVERAAAENGATSAEADLLANWALPPDRYPTVFEARLTRFLAALQVRLTTAEGWMQVFELADSRRREFRGSKLAEFRLTTAITAIPEDAPFLEFDENGAVRPK